MVPPYSSIWKPAIAYVCPYCRSSPPGFYKTKMKQSKPGAILLYVLNLGKLKSFHKLPMISAPLPFTCVTGLDGFYSDGLRPGLKDKDLGKGKF